MGKNHIRHEYFNRELSWLEFNQRVLDEALDRSNPLLERVKFIAISGSNLDEFFMVRVGGLILLSESGSSKTEISGLTVNEQLEQIRQRVREMHKTQSDCILNELELLLAENDIRRLRPEELNINQRNYLGEVFADETSAVVAPIAIEEDKPFPLLAGAGVCLCVRIKSDSKKTIVDTNNESNDRFVIVPLGRTLSRFVSIPTEAGFEYILLEDMVGIFLTQLFAGQEILDWTTFRITRNADVALDDAADDLLAEMTALLRKRILSDCIRLELSSDASKPTSNFLCNALSVSENDVYRIDGPLDLASYFSLASLQGFSALKDAPWPSQQSPDFLSGDGVFDTIAANDRILVHPYQSYDPVVNFIRAASEDPNVIAIKQTLYRTARDSEIINALVAASENGKHVTVITELKARFDEARNIQGAQRLEQAGVDVVYGIQGLKVHAKICIVVRREDRGIQRYIHFGTGNYNESTASLYSDISYFTNDPQIGTDAVHFFNAITGLSVPQHLELLSAAPIDCRESLEELIQIEAANVANGGTGEINAKLNSLVDQRMIDVLYQASQAGVKIKLNVRGICCLKPGVPGLSENIEVISIVDRILEHARIFHFKHGGDDLVYISSADWMTRNLDRRVELLVPVIDPACKNRVMRILMTYFLDDVKCRRLTADGYVRSDSNPVDPFRSQERLYNKSCEMFEAFSNPKATVFKAHRGETG